MINNPKYFYELFLKTRYRNDFTRGDLKKYAELTMLSDTDFKKVKFDKAVQKVVMGRYLGANEERIDKVILHSDMFAKMAMSFIEQQLNPYQVIDPSHRWPFLSNEHKALLLKYLVNLKASAYNTEIFKQLLLKELDFEMIPERYLRMPSNQLKENILIYDPDYVSEKQLTMGE